MEFQGHYKETFCFLLVIHLYIDLFDFLLFVYCQHIFSLFYPMSLYYYFGLFWYCIFSQY